MVPIFAFVVAASALLATGPVAAVPGPVGSEFRVSDDTPGHSFFGDLTMGSSGEFVVTWTTSESSSASGSDVFARRFDAAAQPLGSGFQVNTFTTGDQLFSGVAAAAAGNFIVVWTDFSGQDGSSDGVYAQRFTDAGVPVGPEFQVNTYTTSDQGSPGVAADPAGNLLVAWESESQGESDNGIFAQRYDTMGAAQGPELQVNTTPNFASSPRVAADGAGNFVVVWANFTGGGIARKILVQRFDAGGSPIGGEFQANVFTGTGHRDPAVAATPAGSFVIVWDEGAAILARRYDASGSPLAAPFQVTASGDRPSVATNTPGAFVIAWEDADGDSVGVFGRRYDAAGNALGTAFQVNTYTPDSQSDSKVGIDATGAFVVIWTSSQDGEDRGVFGQRFDAIGVPIPGHVPVSGASLTIVDRDPARRSVQFRTTDGKVGNGINPLISPTIQGATLQVFNASGSGDSACFTLPASGWRNVGTPDDPLFVYRDPDYANGPCSVARIRRGKFMRASCRSKVQPIGYTLDEPMQGSVGVSLTVGPATYCALFGGGSILIDEAARHRFRAAAAPAPPGCPVPPAACP